MMNKQNEGRFKQLGLNIQYYRKMKGMTQQDLADACQLSRTQIGVIENPNIPRSTTLGTLLDIAEALGVEVTKLFDFKEV
jgi:transcriptional regulator with XRE-family HTH domain